MEQRWTEKANQSILEKLKMLPFRYNEKMMLVWGTCVWHIPYYVITESESFTFFHLLFLLSSDGCL